MNATKILWGQVFAVSTVVLAFIWAATEWTAWRLVFQPQLGYPTRRAIDPFWQTIREVMTLATKRTAPRNLEPSLVNATQDMLRTCQNRRE
jgi:hypothetical protein